MHIIHNMQSEMNRSMQFNILQAANTKMIWINTKEILEICF